MPSAAREHVVRGRDAKPTLWQLSHIKGVLLPPGILTVGKWVTSFLLQNGNQELSTRPMPKVSQLLLFGGVTSHPVAVI